VPTDLRTLLADTTAVVTCEVQRGVVGNLVGEDNPLVGAVTAHGTVQAVARLVTAARAVNVPVVHALVEFRADRAGAVVNTPLMAVAAKDPGRVLQGSPAAELVPELGPEPADIVCRRIHGHTPFTGTDLDPILRNLGVRTIVVAGVSVNLGIMGVCISAADLGYRLVVPTDAVAGVPDSYAADALRYSIGLLATLTSVDDVVKVWQERAA
jgi:nicotinamidase-related amidase